MKCPLCSGEAVIERRIGGKPFEVYCKKCKQWFKMKTMLIPFNPANEFEDDIPFDIGLRESLLRFAMQMERILKKHDDEKEDSWKGCDMEYLFFKLDDEIKEWHENVPQFNDYSDHNDWVDDLAMGKVEADELELIDIANICMMLYHRLQGEG